MNLLLWSLLVALFINIAMFIPAYLFKTDKITDISYAITFAVVALYAYSSSTMEPLHLLVLVMVLAWAIRLGSFLFVRINYMGKDARFDGMREKFFSFLRFWLLQGMTVFVVLVAALLAYSQETPVVTWLSYVGLFVWVSGLLIEATADMQKFAFNKRPNNKHHWIDSGIWRMSRHPNYLGEMMVWIGMYVVVMPSLTGSLVLGALASPLYIMLLLLFVSGIPLLEKSADKKWGSIASYKAYKKQVPVLVPTLSSVKRLLHN